MRIVLNRREFSKLAGLWALASSACSHEVSPEAGVVVNDVHSRLNPTEVVRVESPDSVARLQLAVRQAAAEGAPVSVAGGRHAMGAQQFGSGCVHLDLTKLNRVLGFDPEEGTVEVEAGIEWPELIGYLVDAQQSQDRQWGIRQKQTGADRLTIGGALAANAHGRGLTMKPFVSDVESFRLLTADGTLRTCSREENSELFRLVAGGYGLFGIVTSATLRLTPRRKIERVVEIAQVKDIIAAFDGRISDGFLYGDCQFSIDENSPDFLQKGVFSCYRPVDDDVPAPEKQRQLAEDDWNQLIYLAHADKSKVFDSYSGYYLSTSGQVYWSDTHQLSTYLDDYHVALDRRMGSNDPASEIITEIYVPRGELNDFMTEAAKDFREHKVNVIYGTIRLIERDDESFLAWAKQPYACIIFNLHTVHTPEGIEHSAAAFRRLIDMAIRRGGSYFLTYHKFAKREQVEACYPQMPEFLRLKRKYDPKERFQSDWYRHYREMFA